MSWIDFLDDVTKKYPQKFAIAEQKTNRRYTYQQLKYEVGCWARFLQEKNIIQGDRVVYIETNSLEHVTLFLACARLGAIFVPMNWRLGDREKEEIIGEISPKLVLSKNDCQLNINETPFVNISSINPLKLAPLTSYPSVSLSEPLLMLFTSGSTGNPKGVLLHGEMLKSNQEQTCQGWSLNEHDITMVETPFFHTGGYNVLLLPLLSIGGSAILAEKFDCQNFFATVPKEKLTVYFAVPTMFQQIAHHQAFHKAQLSSLRFLVSGGAHCPVDMIRAYQDRSLMFKQGFGLTEVGPNCFLLAEKDAIRKVGSIGKPMPHSQVKLINDEGEVATGEVGELVIKGPHVCAGYYQNKKQFEDSLIGDYFKTGDLARKDEEGYFYIVGRKKDMYISGGENVYPAEVEKRINSHAQIDESIVVSVPHKKWGEVGFTFYTATGPSSIELQNLREYLNPLISRYKHPHFLKKIDQFPLLDNGKIDRKRLKEIALEQGISHESRSF